MSQANAETLSGIYEPTEYEVVVQQLAEERIEANLVVLEGSEPSNIEQINELAARARELAHRANEVIIQ